MSEKPNSISGLDSTNEPEPAKINYFGAACFLIFLFSFFGGGLLVFINGFFPFLGEKAFVSIALVLVVELLFFFVAGVSMRVISAMRRLTAKPGNSPPGANRR